VKVALLRHTPEPERTVAMAARLCYSASTISELEGKAGLITGGTTGLGLETARRFLDQGARVVVLTFTTCRWS